MFGKLVESEGSSPGTILKAEKKSFEIVDFKNENRRCSDLQMPFGIENTSDPYQIVSTLKTQNNVKMNRTGMNF